MKQQAKCENPVDCKRWKWEGEEGKQKKQLGGRKNKIKNKIKKINCAYVCGCGCGVGRGCGCCLYVRKTKDD